MPGARRLGSRRSPQRRNRPIPLIPRDRWPRGCERETDISMPIWFVLQRSTSPGPASHRAAAACGNTGIARGLNNIVQEEISMRNAMIVAAAMALTPAALSAQAAGGSMGALGAAQSGGPGTTPVEQTTGSVGTGTLETMTPAATNLGSGATSLPAHHRRKSARTPSPSAASSSAGSPNSAPK